LIALLVVYLPLPRLFDSIVSRTFVALLLSFSLLQIAATLQFLLFPRSNFIVLALLISVLHIAVLWLAPKRDAQKLRIFSPLDVGGLMTIGIFAAAFTPIFIGNNSIGRIAEIGSLQAIDATNHYAGISEMAEAQHFTYEPGYYYPKGFHITIGFVQQTIFGAQYDLGWRDNVLLYFTQYIAMGSMLAYAIYAFTLSWVRRLGKFAFETVRSQVLLALCVGPIMALLYILPFVAHGFLNYYYVIATILIAAIVVIEWSKESKASDSPLTTGMGRWDVSLFLLLLFGASVSWPLLIPPLLVIGALFVLPEKGSVWQFTKSCMKPWAIPIALLLVLQFLPIYFQLAYSGSDGSQGINLTGGLKAFHPLVLLAGLGVVVWVVMRQVVDASLRRAVHTIFMPLFAFVALLVIMQYFTVGDQELTPIGNYGCCVRNCLVGCDVLSKQKTMAIRDILAICAGTYDDIAYKHRAESAKRCP
jgi:hypothetical protein